MTRLIGRQRPLSDGSGLGYNETPPPFNQNFSYLKTDVSLKDEDESSLVTNNTVGSSAKPIFNVFVKSSNAQTKPEAEINEKPSVSSNSVSSTSHLEATDPNSKMKNMTCFKCREVGHVASRCSLKNSISKGKGVKSDEPIEKVRSPPVSPVKILKNTNDNRVEQTKTNRPGLGSQNCRSVTFNLPPHTHRSPTRVQRDFVPKSTSGFVTPPRPVSRTPTPLRPRPVYRTTTPPPRPVYRTTTPPPRPVYRTTTSPPRHIIRTVTPTRPQNTFNDRRSFPSHFESNNNGHYAQFTSVNEKGKSRHSTAWVPRGN